MKRIAYLVISMLFSVPAVHSQEISFEIQKAQQPKIMLPVGHTHKITVAAFSPDGKKLVTGSEDKTIKLWDTQTGKLLANLKGHTGRILTVSFNRKGDRIISNANLDKTARLWNAHTGELVKEILRSSYSVEFIKFNPAGDLILTEDHSRTPSLLSSATGEPLVSLEGSARIDHADFSPDGKFILSTDGSDTRIFETSSGKQVAKLDGNDPIAVTAGKMKAVTTSFQKIIYIWDILTGDSLFTFRGLDERPDHLFVSPDGSRLVAGGINEPVLKLWDIENGKFLAEIRTGSFSNQVHFSADGKILYTTGYLQETRAWETTGGRSIPFSQGSAIVTKAGQGDIFAVNHNDTGVILSGNRILDLAGSGSLEYAVFSEDGSKLFGAGGIPGHGTIWDARNGRLVSELKGFTTQVRTASPLPGLKYFSTTSQGSSSLWSVRDNLIYPVNSAVNENAEHLVFSPRGDLIISIGEDRKRPGIWDPSKKVSLWNAHTEQLINPQLWVRGMQDISALNPGGYIFSADGKKLFISNLDWGSYIMDAYSGKMLKEIRHDRLWFATVSPAFTRFITQLPNTDGSKPTSLFRLSDTETGQLINEWELSVVSAEPVKFISENRFIAFDVDAISVFDEKGKKPRMRFANGAPEFSRDLGKVIVTSVDNGMELFDLRKEKKVFAFKPPENVYFWKAIWSADEKQVIYSTNDGMIQVADALTGQHLHSIRAPGTDLQRSENGELLFALFEDSVTVINAGDFSIISKLKGHEHQVKNVFRLPGKDKLLTIAADNTARIWSLSSGKLLYTYLIMDRNYQFAMIPSGYYMSNPAATRLLHYVSPDLRVISFEQLDVKYNRPDLVLEGAGSENSLLVSSYQKAWMKRLKRLGIDPGLVNESHSLPQAEIRNRDQVVFEQKEGKLALHITAADSLYRLSRLHIWINENPVFGQKGLALKKGVHQLDTTIIIQLNEGANQLETSVTNEQGAESYRMPLAVNYSPREKIKPVTHFIGFGVDHFTEPRYNLQYSVKDIRDLAVKLREKYGDELVVDTLFNEKLSSAGLRELKKKLQKGNVNDRVIISYSGHGLLSRDFDYYLSTTSINFDRPEENGIPYEEVESLLDSIPARKKLLLIDACHSGEVDKDDLVRLEKAPDSLVKGLKPVAYKKEGQVGLQNSFELMQSLFVNVGKSTGATVISAAAGTQFALERNDLENGVFTYSILQTMKENEVIKVSELKSIVAEKVLRLTDGLQRPTGRGSDTKYDWNVW